MTLLPVVIGDVVGVKNADRGVGFTFTVMGSGVFIALPTLSMA